MPQEGSGAPQAVRRTSSGACAAAGEVMPTPGPCSALRACARSAPPRARVPRAGRGAPLGDDLSRYDADLP